MCVIEPDRGVQRRSRLQEVAQGYEGNLIYKSQSLLVPHQICLELALPTSL
jgi:hypothetical protein